MSAGSRTCILWGMAAQRSASKYNEKVHVVIVDAIRAGNYKGTAARLAGVHPDTFHGWMMLARDNPEASPHDVTLQEDVEQADAEFEAEMVSQVTVAANSGAPNTWQAAMTIMERKNPDRWGKRDHVKIDADKPLVQLNQVIIHDDNARQLSRDLLRQLATGSADVALGISAGGESEVIEDGEFTELSD